MNALPAVICSWCVAGSSTCVVRQPQTWQNNFFSRCLALPRLGQYYFLKALSDTSSVSFLLSPKEGRRCVLDCPISSLQKERGRVGEQFLWCFWHINSACTFYLPSSLSQGLYLYLLSQHAVFSVPSPISIFSLSPVPFKSAIATKNFSSSKEVSLASDFWQKREHEPRDQIPRETLQLSN